ncbi:MAG TPA: MarR family winged helix-turn-helix transcriptional regulator [Marmoricola sp.]|nr:MarR family winged helix-turn-helix transcriptional regulator [Marmoricola sp.]
MRKVALQVMESLTRPEQVPFVALAEKAARALRAEFLEHAHEQGFTELTSAHNAVFATLPPEGARSVDMAARAGITRQSMGEAIRDLAGLGIVKMEPDRTDRRAKVVTWTKYGRKVAQSGFDHLAELEQRFTAEFGSADYEVARAVLERIREMLEQEAS